MEIQNRIFQEIDESIAVKRALAAEGIDTIAQIVSVIVRILEAGNKVILFGNGGSAADAQHIAAEFIGRYRSERIALPALALTTNTSVLTALGNDYGFEEVFARQIAALGGPGDVAIAISTSGNSLNVLRALEVAKSLGLFTVGLAGRTGGKMRALTDICLCVPSDATPRIQEAHILVGHILSGFAEETLLRRTGGEQQRVLFHCK